MKITFLGATHEVTGSCTYLEVGDKRGLVDYGMEQGKDIYVNEPLPVPPEPPEPREPREPQVRVRGLRSYRRIFRYSLRTRRKGRSIYRYCSQPISNSPFPLFLIRR